jgi:hypothetical protein
VIDRVGGWVASLRKRQPTVRRETAKGKGSETEGPGNDDVVISNHLPVSGNFSFHSAAIRRWWRGGSDSLVPFQGRFSARDDAKRV